MGKLDYELHALSVFMKEKIRHLIAVKLIEKGDLKLQMRNLILLDMLTEEIQDYYLDKLRLVDEDIETLKKVLEKLDQ